MKKLLFLLSLALGFSYTESSACDQCSNYNTNDFKIIHASVIHYQGLGITVWEMKVGGTAGKTLPTPAGKLNGAPVLGYVFPTTLSPADIGFSPTEGVVALALTSHPDFDDSPLWDENMDGIYSNDGLVWHPHWVVLVKDERVPGGLAVKEHKKGESITKPSTSPDMPMYMDSPGFNVLSEGKTIRVVVPTSRLNNNTRFQFDAVTAYMEVNTGESGGHDGNAKPMLGVYKVYTVLSGNLSLPYKVKSSQTLN